MKKKILIWAIILVAVVLLVPRVSFLKDGGSILFDGLLYDFEKVHSLWHDEETEKDGYLVGYRFSVLGRELFDHTHFETE